LHLALCGALWSGLLVVAFAFVALRIGTRRFPVAESAALALAGLGLVAVLGLVCPDPRMLMWWMDTPVGRAAESWLGAGTSALCFGLCLAGVAGAGASVLFALRGLGRGGVHLSAVLLFLLLWPVVIVQSLGSSPTTFAGWSIGLGLGAWVGVALGAAGCAFGRRAAPA
jgi:hypothetical protein